MAKMKKAFILSSTAILLVLLFVVSLNLNKEAKNIENKITSTNTRVKILNNLVNDLESNYFERILYVASKSAMNSLAEYKLSGGNLPTNNDFNEDFANALVYGVIKNADAPDGIQDYHDNCRNIKNPQQQDSDNDGVGDACKYSCDDYDQDGVCDASDNCPITQNLDQRNIDGIGMGDACQSRCQNNEDSDADEICNNGDDLCPIIWDPYNSCGTDSEDADMYLLIDDIAPRINMQEKSISAYKSRIEGIFNDLGIKINKLKVSIINARHSSPWTIDIEAKFEYNVEDKNHISSWEGTTIKKASISIVGFRSPFGDNSGEIIIRDGANRWVGHSNPQDADSGSSFLARLGAEVQEEYGICKEDNQHCGRCDIGCASGETCIDGACA